MMASPTSTLPLSKSPNHYSEGLQTTPNDLRSLTPSMPGREDKKRNIGSNLLHPSYLQHDSYYSFLPDRRLSPVGTIYDRFPSPIALAGTIPISSLKDNTASAAARRFCNTQWRKHKALILVFAAQLFAALMNVSARLLELGEVDAKLHPMQLLFYRMLVTTIGSALYANIKPIRHGLFGPPKLRWLLILRGFAGFTGIYGMWYSMEYIPLAEATVITFLAPHLTGYLCYLFLREPYTRTEQLASLLALGGVVMIAKPTSMFSFKETAGEAITPAPGSFANTTLNAAKGLDTVISSTPVDTVTASARLGAIVVALFGVLGGSIALTTLRAIGKRVHVLVSVNYFGIIALIITFTTLSLAPYLDIGQPDLHLGFPTSLRQWGLVAFTAVCGLTTQILTTKGVSAEKSNRATAMMYTQMLFAAGFDRFVWGTTMGWMSTTGCTMIIIGALWAALGNKGGMSENRGYDEADVERDPSGVTRGEGDVLLGDEPEDQNEENVPMQMVR